MHLLYRVPCVYITVPRGLELRTDNSPPTYSRPTSLYPLKPGDGALFSSDSLQPEREPVKFEVNLVGAPPEVEQLVNNIKHVAEQFLYHWKTFPISKYRFTFESFYG